MGLVGPMITYLLPLLIAYTGGRMVYDVRGGVVGAIGTMGVIVGAGIPMFIGAMIMGPLGGWTMKKIDSIWDGKIRPGFEMLVNNFSAGIWGALLAMLGFYGISPLVTAFSTAAGNVVQFLVNNGLLPLTSIFIEPAKVLFLNNAINHGVLTPLGIQQSLEQGKSILFLLEANPGPGLGILLAYMFFGKGLAKASAPGAAIIHFLGGIHEIYFPYVLMKPDADPRRDRRRHDRYRHPGHHRLRPRGPGGPGLHHRGARPDLPRQLRRRDPLGAARHHGLLPDRLGDPEGQQDHQRREATSTPPPPRWRP